MVTVDERNWPNLLAALVAGDDLSRSSAEWAMQSVMTGEATSAQLAALLIALRINGETVDEITGFRDAVLARAVPLAIDSRVLDIVGTGGDPYGAVLNISSVASIIAAAVGVPVVKHGNRAASSASGSSDLLSTLGINLEVTPEQTARIFDEVGITFAFASLFHPGFRHAAATRKELGIPTLFNILGPLCNPARPSASAVGVADLRRVPLITGVLQKHGSTALVYRGEDGIDKLTTTGNSRLWEITHGAVAEHVIDPRELGIARADISSLLGAGPAHNADIARRMLAGERGPVRDVVLLNAAAGLVAWELSRDPNRVHESFIDRLAGEYKRAESAIDSGAASDKLERWVAASRL